MQETEENRGHRKWEEEWARGVCVRERGVRVIREKVHNGGNVAPRGGGRHSASGSASVVRHFLRSTAAEVKAQGLKSASSKYPLQVYIPVLPS